MKNLKKLKLTQLSNAELEKKELNKLRGGNCCICGCSNGSMENGGANYDGSLYSPAGGYGSGSYG